MAQASDNVHFGPELLFIVVDESRLKFVSHFLESVSSATHFSAFVVILLNFLDCEPELPCDIVNSLVNDMHVGNGHDSLRRQFHWLIRVLTWGA
jgi:hypothetical protein